MVSERGGDVETPAAALAAAVQEAAAPPPAKDSADGADSGGGGAGSPKPPPLPRPLSPTLSEAASESSSGVQSSVSPHYDAQRDVILRLEFLRTAEVKTIIRAVWAAVFVGFVLLSVALYVKIDRPEDYYLQDDTVPLVNISFGAVLCSALLACWFVFVRRVYRSNLTGKRWSHRRRRAATMAGIELTLQLVNCIFFVVPNAWVLAHECSWMEPVVVWAGFVRWTIWNTLFLMFWIAAHSACPARSPRWSRHIDRPDAAIMDGPLWLHWPKLGLWLLLEGILLALTIEVKEAGSTFQWNPAIPNCREQAWSCEFNTAGLVLVALNMACLVAYFLLYFLFIARAMTNLKHLPYNSMRMANQAVRLQIRLRSPPITFFLLCAITYTFVKINTCSSYIISWLGYLPMQLVMTSIAIANAYMSMPKRPHQMGILQVWLQEFAWTEAEVSRKRSERASSLPPESYEGFCLDCEPMFCMETAIKMLYWSLLVYDHGEQRASPVIADTALLLYDLEHFEVFWEKSLDTKAVVGWNSDTVVIAFRGTASMANLRADLQVWRRRWPEGIGTPLLCSAPQVHQGFHACYTANNFNERLLSRLQHILYRCTANQQEAGSEKPVTVYVTGHSLGGALATLCAYDIKKRCPCAEYMINVKCYTFGAPRPGNHAFARMYNEAVPDTWHLVNNDDVITKAGKFWVLYKRTGHRVLLNKMGDLVVRPSYVETAIRGVPGGASVKDHLLTQYQKALMAVVAAQFGKKSVSGGKDGVLSMAQQKGMRDVLQSGGMTARELRVLQERGWDAYQRLLRRTSSKGRSKCKARRWGSGKQQEMEEQLELDRLEGVVVVEAEEKPAEQAMIGHPRQAAEPAAAAGVPGGAGAAAPPPAATAAVTDLEAGVGAPPQQQITSEEQDGVLHTTHLSCRQRGSLKCQTICTLLNRRPTAAGAAAAAHAAEPAAPELDAPPATPQPLQLRVIAEEEGEEEEEQPPSPAASSPQQRRRRRGPWERLSSLLGLGQLSPSASSSLGATLSSRSSLGADSSGPPSPSAAAAGTRGALHDAPDFPLVLAWGGSGGVHGSGSAVHDSKEQAAAGGGGGQPAVANGAAAAAGQR